jgi:hypothetical protein
MTAPEYEYMIEARRKGTADEWEPISLQFLPDRVYHYVSRDRAQQALAVMMETDSGLLHLLARLATGGPKIDQLMEFRIVEVRVAGIR